jgi:catechol 2,3-dioxygenase-like lactoylglutathione lyase family enzyme
MRRFHVHVAVDDISKSTAFYTKLFGQPARVEADYVKWMLEDPRLNFAISSRGQKPGVNHLGLQMDSDEELKQLRAQLEAAELVGESEATSHCCYSTSDKYWVTDPQGVAWETYHTLTSIPTFGGESSSACGSAAQRSCCVPAAIETADAPRRSRGCCA